MNITLKGLKGLASAEMVFIVAMMKTYGDLKIEELQTTHNTDTNNKNNNNNKNRNRHKTKQKQPPKVVKNHDDCTSKEPCLYDFDCPGWEQCEDDKFLQYRLIMEKCEKQ